MKITLEIKCPTCLSDSIKKMASNYMASKTINAKTASVMTMAEHPIQIHEQASNLLMGFDQYAVRRQTVVP